MAAYWCVLVWMSASPDLVESSQQDLAEASDAVRMLNNPDDLTVRVCINQRGLSQVWVLPDTGKPPPHQNPLMLTEFLQQQSDVWNEAKRRVLVVWGHGVGLIEPVTGGSRAAGALPRPELVVGEVPKPELLVKAVTAAKLKPPDVVGYDACSMGSLQVVSSLAGLWTGTPDMDAAVITSQVPEPASGWPYHRVLREVGKFPMMTATDLARVVVDAYAETTDLPDFSIAAFNPHRLGDLERAVEALCGFVMKDGRCPPLRDILEAASRASLPDSPSAVDLGTFVAQLDIRVELDGHAQDVLETLARAVLHRRAEGRLKGRSGLSVDLPDCTSPGFRGGKPGFFKKRGWNKFWTDCVCSPERLVVKPKAPAGT